MTPLTREAIKAASGRGLDALVAVHVMNMTVFPWPQPPPRDLSMGIPSANPKVMYRGDPVPAYSTSGDAMLTVLEKMRERGVYVSMQPYRAGGWIADCDHVPEANSTYAKPISYSRGEGLPEAVAKAALLAILSQKAST